MSVWSMFNPQVPHPFSSSASNDEWVMVSGIGGHAPDGSIAEDPATQVRDALANIVTLLERAGSSVEEIVWFRPYVTKRKHAVVMNDVLQDWLGTPPPATGALLVTELIDPRMVVEFEAWAQRGAVRESSL